METGLTVNDVHTVEVVGSGSRVPAVIRILTEFSGKEFRRTMNASECVARGATLEIECSILSPTFKVREIQVNESFPFTIDMSWKCESHNATGDNHQSVTVFPKGNSIPSVKALTLNRPGTFTMDVQYADVSQLQAPAKISTYTIGSFQSTKCEKAKVKVKVKVRLNLHGIVSVESATLLEEEEIDVSVVKEARKMDTNEAPVNTAGSDVNMEDAKGTTDVPMGDNDVPDGDNPIQVETDTKVS